MSCRYECGRSCGADAAVVRSQEWCESGRSSSVGEGDLMAIGQSAGIALALRGLVVDSISLSFGVAVTVNVRVSASCCTWNPTRRLEGTQLKGTAAAVS